MNAPARRRIRTYLPEWLLAWVTVAAAGLLRGCGQAGAGFQLLKRFQQRWPRNPVVLAAIIPGAMARQEYPFGVRMIEDLWLNSGHTHYLHRLLFRRSTRPADIDQRLCLFPLIAASEKLPSHYRAYALIVIAYQAISLDDAARIGSVSRDLERLVDALTADQATFSCQRSNRENRIKLLVSVYTALSRLYLASSEFSSFASVGSRVTALLDHLDFHAIDRDSSYRLTRNLMRCLAIDALQAWYLQDAENWQRALLRLRRAHDHCQEPIFDQSNAQEDHRGFAREMLQAVAIVEASDWPTEKRDEQIHHLITLIIKTTYEPRFLVKIRSLFAPYLTAPP
ncbi:hypothetical protein KQ313_02020 [Synechococcus sp. CS-1325]|uniref:hypothetical protein n=1 Tax=unclassified Synechococcus TaxID=2626047 RepID=UPI000DB81EF0|nr:MULTISPECIES: hypothetical protein [unclassified Synechococcus]MCT0198465.1 hypothetical protein [Synechococcus sp. CS-1325]MCT0213585.1 hypothetical protein [Synechococcus sp. CS-1326]MCT0232176.1 hypothetical protein [Synechococcus sp. CS-1327]PZV01741.1 MAG: hypothetical protein DCF24_03450 [Cyanobium sp.]